MKEQSLREDPIMVPMYEAHVNRLDDEEGVEVYLARCLDFPGVEGHGDSPEEARHSLMTLIKVHHDEYIKNASWWPKYCATRYCAK